MSNFERLDAHDWVELRVYLCQGPADIGMTYKVPYRVLLQSEHAVSEILQARMEMLSTRVVEMFMDKLTLEIMNGCTAGRSEEEGGDT